MIHTTQKKMIMTFELCLIKLIIVISDISEPSLTGLIASRSERGYKVHAAGRSAVSLQN